MSLSSNSIIHFTNTSDALKGILQENFRIKYCQENVILKETFKYASPMVSFCDIPLSQIKEHIGKYGAYGIGLTKEWAQRQKLNPVVYVQSGSNLANSLSAAYEESMRDFTNWSELTDGKKNMLNILRYAKDYEANLSRGGEVIKDYRFSDEREWRYSPDYDDCNKMAIDATNYTSVEQKDELNNSIDSLRLNFEPNDIKYIIIERESEIPDFLEVLKKSKGNRYLYNDVERLMTRIITSEQIMTDL